MTHCLNDQEKAQRQPSVKMVQDIVFPLQGDRY